MNAVPPPQRAGTGQEASGGRAVLLDKVRFFFKCFGFFSPLVHEFFSRGTYFQLEVPREDTRTTGHQKRSEATMG